MQKPGILVVLSIVILFVGVIALVVFSIISYIRDSSPKRSLVLATSFLIAITMGFIVAFSMPVDGRLEIKDTRNITTIQTGNVTYLYYDDSVLKFTLNGKRYVFSPAEVTKTEITGKDKDTVTYDVISKGEKIKLIVEKG